MTEIISIEEFKDLKNKGVVSKSNKPSKYRNKKVVYNGITFDSKKEYEYYRGLCYGKSAGKIKDFGVHVPIRLEVNGYLVCKLIIDFKIYNKNGTIDFIDIKALNKATGKYIVTPDARIKHKLFEALYNQKIILV